MYNRPMIIGITGTNGAGKGQARKDGGNAVIESVRSIGEAEYLKSHEALLWAVDAVMPVRYERVLGRMSETDRITYDQFVADEAAEIANTDTAKPNLRAVIGFSDTVLTNNGTQDGLYAQVEAALAKAAA